MRSDFAYPFFFGAVVTVALGFYVIFPKLMPEITPVRVEEPELAMEVEEFSFPSLETAIPVVELFPELPEHMPLSEYPGKEDFILNYYQNPGTQESVIGFFTSLVHSRDLATLILAKADEFNIRPSLAFALCWEESHFNIRAINTSNSNKTIDRGLFQLNDVSFPNLTEPDFFNPDVNVHYGLSHLRWCLDRGGSVVAGLAMYNAGTVRVSSGGTPKRTLDYISRILESQEKIEEVFNVQRIEPEAPLPPIELSVAEEPEPEEHEPIAPRLSLLSPASRR